MKITTLEYNANQPMTKAMTAPTGSKYYIGVKVNKDGEAVDCGMDELIVDGLSATSQVAGYNVYELSSDIVEGMKQLDVVVNKPAITAKLSSDGVISVRFTQLGGSGKVKNIYLSGHGLPDTLTLRPNDIQFDKIAYTVSSATGWSDEVHEWENVTSDGLLRIYINNVQTYDKMSSGWRTRDNTLLDEITIDTNAASIQSSSRMMPYNQAGIAFLSGYVTIDTKDGLSANFPLQVSQKDMGYIDVDGTEVG